MATGFSRIRCLPASKAAIASRVEMVGHALRHDVDRGVGEQVRVVREHADRRAFLG
jgi:hypothetical protein